MLTAPAAAVTLFLLAAAAAPGQMEAVRTTVIIDAAAASGENWACSEGTLWHCQEYMMEEAVRRGGVIVGGVNGGNVTDRREIDLKMCCCKLKEMEAAAEGTTCSVVEEAMRRLVAEQKQRGDVIMGEEELMNAWNVAEELPRKCAVVNSPAKCRFNSRQMITSS